MKRLLLLLLLPVYAMGQEVEPVLSADYLKLIREDSLRSTHLHYADSTNSIRYSRFKRVYGPYNRWRQVGSVTMHDSVITIEPLVTKTLYIGGRYTVNAGIRTINRTPALQSTYAQGRSGAGQLQWRGPETGELFSYGPALRDLEFDNTPYDYDVHGKLVPAGTGNGQPANAYNNNIFRTGAALTQSLAVRTRYTVNSVTGFSMNLKLTKGREQLVMHNNTDHFNSLMAETELRIRKWMLLAAFTTERDRNSNSNRNGFLNRVYQQSLLAPASFDNNQGIHLTTGQRSYSDAGDNAWYLLRDNGNSYLQSQQAGRLAAEKRFGQFRVKLSQTMDVVRQQADEGYRATSAFFPTGLAIHRHKEDRNLLTRVNASYDFNNHYQRQSSLTINYLFADNTSTINYLPGSNYRYQRSFHDLSADYRLLEDFGGVQACLYLTNKLYASNTTPEDKYFMPGASAYVKFDELFYESNVTLKLVGTYTRFNSELPVDRSYAGAGLFRYSTAESLQYFPLQEVAGFEGLDPVRHREWTTRLELNVGNRISFQAEYFNRLIRDDIFPVWRGNTLELVNMAAHRYQGVELTLSQSSPYKGEKKVRIGNNFSLVTYRNKVIRVKDGYEFTPTAGFNNVNKALVTGASMGAITGNRFQRDASNNILIGNDGFPLATNTPAVIADAIPDFVCKFSHNLVWKNISFDVDWEWKKGGDTWNGTQALLDYYGRSANSAALRTTANYIFPGVLASGHVNNIPVQFYDVAMPVENNRWTRYGHTGIAEAYIQKADYVRLNNVSLHYKLKIPKYLQVVDLSLYAGNIIIWTPYAGGDPGQLLYEQTAGAGLDFFNLPSSRNMGVSVSIQF